MTVRNILLLATLNFSACLGRPSIYRTNAPQLSYDPNITPYCTGWIDNDGSMSCSEILSNWAIKIADFTRWNPSVSSTCGGFQSGKAYCVEALGEPSIHSRASSTSTASVKTITTTRTTTIRTRCGPSSTQSKPLTTTRTKATTTTTSTSTSTTTSTKVKTTITTTSVTCGAPSPTQSGQIATCNQWDLVQPGNTCATYLAQYPGLTLADLVQWNPAIGPQCQFLRRGTYLCTGVNGWKPRPQISTATTTTTTTSATTTTTPPKSINTPQPIQPGMVSNCRDFHKVEAGEVCHTIADSYGISVAQFISWNPGVGSDCHTLWLGYFVCVFQDRTPPPPPPPPTTTTTTTTTKTTTTKTTTTTRAAAATTTTSTKGITTPTPTQPGMVANCDAFYLVQPGDRCVDVARSHGISLPQFYSWNPTVGANCETLWSHAYVCVGLSPTTSIATPTPTQPGTTGSCKRFHLVVSGDECGVVAAHAGVSLADFLAWNPGVGPTCASLWLGYYVCIGV